MADKHNDISLQSQIDWLEKEIRAHIDRYNITRLNEGVMGIIADMPDAPQRYAMLSAIKQSLEQALLSGTER